MASSLLPPPPTGSPPGSFAWQDWYFKLNQYLSSAGTILWANVNKAGSNITDIAIRNHNDLQAIQGGAAGQYYHLTSAQLTVLNNTSGTNTGDQTNITGNAGTVTTNANLTGPITSVGNATSVASQTGTGTKFVMDTSPTLVTPTLGAATVTTINKMTITSPATASTLAVADGKTFTVSKTLTLTGTDGTTMTFPSTTATIARTDAAQTFTGTQTFTTVNATSGINATNGSTSHIAFSANNSGGQTLFGTEDSVGGSYVSGTTAYSGIVGTFVNTNLYLVTNSIKRVTIDTSGGMAVTGGFGCNGKTAQAAVVSDGTLATVITALKANGIMS